MLLRIFPINRPLVYMPLNLYKKRGHIHSPRSPTHTETRSQPKAKLGPPLHQHKPRAELWTLYFIYLIIYFFRAASVVYGGSQSRVWIAATAANLHHSSRQCWIPNPLSKASDRTCVLMDTCWVCFCCTTAGTPWSLYLNMCLSGDCWKKSICI